MKKIISLKNLLAFSLIFGSFYIVDAYNETQKYASKETKKNNKNSKDCIKAVEKELREIKQEFQKNHDAKATNKKLKAIPAKIKKAVAEIKSAEEHGKMWEVHEHTLNRKLDEVKKFISSYEAKLKSKKNAKK